MEGYFDFVKLLCGISDVFGLVKCREKSICRGYGMGGFSVKG